MKEKKDFTEVVFFLRFWFEPSIKNLLMSPTLIAYISKITLNFFKLLKMSDSLDKTL